MLAVATSPEHPEIVVKKYQAMLDHKHKVSAMDRYMDIVAKERDERGR